VIFREIEIESRMNFQNIIFTKTFYFENCNLTKVQIKYCNLSEVNFTNITFAKWNKRTVLLDDPFKINLLNLLKKALLKTIQLGKQSTRKEKNDKTITELYQTYRQLKRKFMDVKDWTEAGDAYRSEMFMKRKLVFYEFIQSPIRKFPLFFNWIIRLFYEFGSGYNQSMVRPLVLLFILIISIALIISPNFTWPCLEPSLARSIESALPLIGKINRIDSEPTYIFYLLGLERILSVMFLTFFILATRNRLRQ